MTQIFISYSRKDLAFIEHLANDLKSYGFDVWYDVSNLGGGARWIRDIQQAITDSKYVIVVLSPDSVISEYVEDEYSFAKRQQKKIIPLLYRPCEPGMLYVNLNHIDVQGGKYSGNLNKILQALDVSTTSQNFNFLNFASIAPRQNKQMGVSGNVLTLSNSMEFVRIPAGKFLMGSIKSNKLAYDDEKPQHTVDIPYDYWMGRFPVTNELYNIYASGSERSGKEDHPCTIVSWKLSVAYCKRLNSLFQSEIPSGLVLRLPTEAEWEKAARGINGREYPWGNTFDKANCNSSESGKRDTTPVSLYSPHGDSSYGCADMVGNVWEWTHSLPKAYPYEVYDGRENENTSGRRVLRGGAFNKDPRLTRCSSRDNNDDYQANINIGFRVCASIALPQGY